MRVIVPFKSLEFCNYQIEPNYGHLIRVCQCLWLKSHAKKALNLIPKHKFKAGTSF